MSLLIKKNTSTLVKRWSDCYLQKLPAKIVFLHVFIRFDDVDSMYMYNAHVHIFLFLILLMFSVLFNSLFLVFKTIMLQCWEVIFFLIKRWDKGIFCWWWTSTKNISLDCLPCYCINQWQQLALVPVPYKSEGEYLPLGGVSASGLYFLYRAWRVVQGQII
jgi:hypothetical protein